ncbi:MAG: InlB B-repeat-containing protein, partial [Phocaeicola sp.]
EATRGKTYTAKFISQYTIVFESSNTDLGTVDKPGGTGDSGTFLESTATAANENCRFVGWYVDTEPVVAGEDITITGNTLKVKLTEVTGGKTYTAKFISQYTIAFESSNTGLGTVDKPGGTGDSGTFLESTATANENCRFVGWYVDTEPVVAGDDITITGNTLKVKLSSETGGKTYTAKFEQAVPTVEFSFTIKTTAANQSYNLPFGTSGAIGEYELTVNWGDGTEILTIQAGTPLTSKIEHTYAEAKEYTITITSSETDYTKAQMPEVSWKDDKLLKTINTPLLNLEVISFSTMFYKCTSLISIPSGLFDNNTKVKNFTAVFYGCSSLTSIPPGLFDKNTAVTSFAGTFRDCSGLTSIPGGLFKDNTKVDDFQMVFSGCSKAKVNPNIFCDEETEKETRFKSITTILCFNNAFNNVGSELTDIEATQSAFPTLWEYTMPIMGITSADCFEGAKASNTNAVPDGWK